MTTARHIYSVSELNSAARMALEQELGLVWLEGEISNIARPASGHWYFTLKDKKAQIRCAFFRNRNRLVNFSPEDGQQVLVRGRISLYEPRGDYQMIVDHMEPAGEGDLQKIFEDLKRRLHEEGLFDEASKQQLPDIPEQIGLITSASGAALHDVLQVLKRRFPLTPVILYPASVQGETAAAELIHAIRLAEKRSECDVLLLVRGGGSLEDLWPFNNEKLARTIHSCTVPIVCGVGHEVDYTIADFVADLRAPTPSVAAELVTPNQDDIHALLEHNGIRLQGFISNTIRKFSQQVDWYQRQLQQAHPGKQLHNQRQQLASVSRHLVKSMRMYLDTRHHRTTQIHSRIHSSSPHARILQYRSQVMMSGQRLRQQMLSTLKLTRYRLQNSMHALDTVSPVATLARGYSISRRLHDSSAVRSASELSPGEKMETRFANGKAISRIESIDD